MNKIQNTISSSKDNSDTQLVISPPPKVEIDLLDEMQEKLKLASEELRRMEDESGIPLSVEQTKKMNAYFRAGQCIRDMMSLAETNLTISQPHKEE